MIPKVIHYCWLSNDPYPEKIQHCINSWKKILPDYEFVLWDTKRFPLDKSPWVKEAFEAKKYAFAADYIRLYALFEYGGIYLDSDVEVLKKFDDLLTLPYFIGNESFDDRVEVAAFGAEKGTTWIKECLEYYEGRHFIKEDGSYDKKVMPDVVFNVTSKKWRINHISKIIDFDNVNGILNVWFCAHVHLTPNDIEPTYIISPDTYCVHHFANSWVKVNKYKLAIKKILFRFGLYKNKK